MFEAKITIETPALAQAINNLAAAIGGANPVSFPNNTPVTAPTPVQPPAQTNPQAPVMPTQMPGPAPVASAPVSSPAPGVPLAQPPKYTVDQIMAAGATLMDAGKVNELMNLLHSFGVQAVMDLKPEQLGAFATALRDLGAKI